MERNRRGRPRHPDVLTPAEWRVLEALREGGTNAEIGARLGIGAETVKYHVANMLAKLELPDRRALASWRPEERRGRLGSWFAVPAAVWSVARPIAWVGAGTAAVAGVVVGVVAVVALVAVALVVAGGDGDPPLAVAPSPMHTPETPRRPTPTVQPSPTATPTPTPMSTSTPQPSPTPTPTPAATASAAPSPTPTVTPSPAATPLPAAVPLPTREELGIREVDTAEALAVAGLTHVRYEAGEEVPWAAGLFLLDVESGAIEGWVWSLPVEQRRTPWSSVPDIPISPSNRFLGLNGVLYDRQAERAYKLGGTLDQWWGSGTEERLLVASPSGGSFVLLDGDLEPMAQFQVPPGERSTGPRGGYILIHESLSSSTFHLVNLADESSPQVHTWELPWKPVSNRDGEEVYRIETLDHLVAFVGRVGDSACHVTRYDLQGVMLSDQAIPCGFTRGYRWYRWDATSLPRISPDGRLIAVPTAHGLGAFAYGPERVGMVLSIFDVATGAEIMRVLGAHPPWMVGEPHSREDMWLADSSGIIVRTRDGPFVARIVGTWGPAPGWAAPDHPNRFVDHGWVPRVVTLSEQGAEQVSIHFGPPAATIHDADPFFRRRGTAGWGARSETLWVRTLYSYGSHVDDYSGTPPLAPVIELPPFGNRLQVEVVVDTCLNVREEHSRTAPVVTCIPHGTVAETDDFFREFAPPAQTGAWMHIRTEVGVEGWAHADYLRWHSDGVRLEE